MSSTNIYINTITELSINSIGKSKYLNWYISIVQRAKNRVLLTYTETHHIVPNCFYKDRNRNGPIGFLDGTAEHKDNLVKLTPEEHQTVHRILLKMFDATFRRYSSLVYASKLMCVDPHGNRLNNKMYGWVKRLISNSIKGENHPLYNKKMSKETCAKKSLSMMGKNRGRILGAQSKEHIKNASNGHKKFYIIIDPDGNEYIIKGLKDFCIANGLHSSCMHAVVSGNRKHHKGWKCKLFID